jgi:MFS family permease
MRGLFTNSGLAPSTQLSASPYRWYALAILTLAQACHALDRSIIGLVLEPVRREFNLTDTQLGFLAGLAYGLAFSIAALPMGLLGDRFNRRNMLACVLVLWSGLTALCGFARSYTFLVLARIAVATAEAGGPPTGMSLISDYFSRRQRTTAIGIWYLSAAIGIVLTFVLGGYVAQHYGWRSAFFLAGLPGLVMAIVIIFSLREPPRGGSDPVTALEATPSLATAVMIVLRRPSVLNSVAGITIVAATISSSSTWMPSFLIRHHGFTISQAGNATAIGFGGCCAIGGLGAAFLSDRLANASGRFRPGQAALVAAFAAFGALFLSIALMLVRTPHATIVLLCCYCLLCQGPIAPANGLVMTLLPARVRGFAVAIIQLSANLVGYGLGPTLVGVISDHIGGNDSLRWGLISVLILNSWAVIHFLFSARYAAADYARLSER